MKVLDRTIPLVQMKMVEVDGNFEGLRIMCNNCFGNPTQIFVPETPLLNSPSAESVTSKLIVDFERAGLEYAKSNQLSKETIQILETPMIPKEVYLDIVNGNH